MCEAACQERRSGQICSIITPDTMTSNLSRSNCGIVVDVGDTCLTLCMSQANRDRDQQWSYDSLTYACTSSKRPCASWKSGALTTTSGNCNVLRATIGPPNKAQTNPSQNRSEIPIVFDSDVQDLTISMLKLSLNFTNAFVVKQTKSAYTVVVSSLSQMYEGNFTVDLPEGSVQASSGMQSNADSNVVSNTVYLDNIPPDCFVFGPETTRRTNITFTINCTENVRLLSPVVTFAGGSSSLVTEPLCRQPLCAQWTVNVSLFPNGTVESAVKLTVPAGTADTVGNPTPVDRSATVQFDNLKPFISSARFPPQTNLLTIPYSFIWNELIQTLQPSPAFLVTSNIPGLTFQSTQASGCASDQSYCNVYDVSLTVSGFRTAAGNISISTNANWARDVAGNINDRSEAVVVMFDNRPLVASFAWIQQRYLLQLTIIFDRAAGYTGQEECFSVSAGSSATSPQAAASSLSFATFVTPLSRVMGVVSATFASGCFKDSVFGNANQPLNTSFSFDTRPFEISVIHVPQLTERPTSRPVLSFIFSALREFANASNDLRASCVSTQAEGGGGNPSFSLAVASINRTAAWFNVSNLSSFSGTLTAGCRDQVFDLFGNQNEGKGQFSVRYDNVRPDPIVAYPTPRPDLNSPIVVSFNFAEVVEGFNSSLIIVSPPLPNSSLVCSSGPASVFFCNISVVAEGSVSFSLPAGVVFDLAGNSNTASNILSPIQFDFVTNKPQLKRPVKTGGFLASSAAFIQFSLDDYSPPSRSCFLIFTQNSTVILNLSFSPTTTLMGDFYRRLKLQDPWAGGLDAPFVVAATGVNGNTPPGLTPGQVYDVTLTYQDALGNPSASDNAKNVLFIPLVSPNTLSPRVLVANGPTNISFSGVFAAQGTNMNVSVSYGNYNCTVVAFNFSLIMCTAPLGVGANMPIVVTLFHYESLKITGDSLSYTPPFITNSSLRMGGNNGTSAMNAIGLSRSGGDILSFTGGNWGSNLTLVSVLVGNFHCPLLLSQSNSSVLTCTTAIGSGSYLTFTVSAGALGYVSASAPSDFTYSYPAAPVISSIRGCADNNSTGETTQCPTLGNVSITLIGSRFPVVSTQVLVYVNAQLCPVVTPSSATQIVCILPAGTGLRRAVQVFDNQTFSPVAFLLSYALPSVSSVQAGAGCAVYNASGLFKCARTSFPLITVQGSNFGMTDSSNSAIHAGLWVGLKACTNVQHDATSPDTKFTCNLPAGQGSVPLFISQYNTIGFYSVNFTVNYDHCPRGFEDAADGACVECAPGKYSGSQDAECINCPLGQYTSTSSSGLCFTCAAGRYAAIQGQSECSNCSAGKFSGISADECSACAPGTFSNGTAAACLSCEAGTFSDVPGSAVCSPCQPGTISSAGDVRCILCEPGLVAQTSRSCKPCAAGTYSNFTNCIQCAPGSFSSFQSAQCQQCRPGTMSTVQADACVDCGPGTYARNSGLSVCDLCSPGTFQNISGQNDCLPCDYDTYSVMNKSATCVRCPSGSVAQPGQTVCLQCEGGKYATLNHECQSCSAGTRSVAGSTVCTACEPGQYSDAGTVNCTECEPGKFLGQGYAECTVCSPGLYTNQSGMFACYECGSGSVSWPNATGCEVCLKGYEPRQNECKPCDPNYFSNITGGVCAACPRGKATIYTGATVCEACTAGRFNPADGFECKDCAPGKFANTTQAVECKPCPAGEKNELFAAPRCSVCGPGQYSEEGAIECSDCPPGTFHSNVAQSSCSPCAPGSFSLQAATVCEPCARGQFSTTGGQCTDCGAGTYGAQTNLTACTLCEAGKYQNANASSSCEVCKEGRFAKAGQAQCTSCSSEGDGMVALNNGSAACTACPDFSVAYSPSERTECRCQAGYYMNPRNFTCEVCPKGANCESSGTTTLIASDGYWQSRLSNVQFYSCLFPSRCVNNGCSSLRTGPLCMNCVPGYKESAVEQTCGACSEIAQNTGVYTTLLLILAAIVIFVVYWVMLRRTGVELQKLQDDWGETLFGDWSLSGADQSVITSQGRLHRETINENALAEETKFQPPAKKLPLWLQSKRAPSVVQKAKIVASFFQIITSGFAQRVPWPAEYRAFSLGVGAVLNIDFVPWQRVNCALDIGFLAKSRLVAAVPLFFAVVLFIWYLILLWLDYRKGGVMVDRTFYNSLRVKSSVKIWKVSIVTVFLLYPYVSSTVLSVYNCRTVDDQSYLVRDFTVHCDPGSDWATTAYTNIIFVIIYPIGVPLCSFLLLYYADLTDPLTIVKLGFLYQAFTIKCWYFELIDMLFKLTLTSLVEFFSLEAELRIALFLCTLYLVLVLLLNPFTQKGNDRLRQLALVELYLMGFIGVMLCMSVLGETNPTVSYGFTAVILVSLPVLLTFWTLAISAQNVRKLVQMHRNKAEAKFLKVTKPPPLNING